MLSADDVLTLEFPAGTMFTSGYSADAVDRWLDLVVSTLRAYEGDPAGELRVLAADARAVRFAERRGRAAYDPQHVDDAIDMIAATLAMHEAEADRGASRGS